MPLAIDWLGTVPYGRALELQKQAVEECRSGRCGDRLLLLEHPPVVTLGRRARAENLRVPESELQRRGIELQQVSRGGDVTYHGPGQLVGYPIVDLGRRGERDVLAWLRRIEGCLIEALAALGLSAMRVEGRTGVFVAGARPPRKIASIGVGLRGWVTWHGFALNVTLDPAAFDVIVPCGLHDVEMTNLARETGRSPDRTLFGEARERVGDVFRRELA